MIQYPQMFFQARGSRVHSSKANPGTYLGNGIATVAE